MDVIGKELDCNSVYVFTKQRDQTCIKVWNFYCQRFFVIFTRLAFPAKFMTFRYVGLRGLIESRDRQKEEERSTRFQVEVWKWTQG